MQNSNTYSSNHSFKLIKSKNSRNTHCHGVCMEEQNTSLTLNRSKKYLAIESNYSKKNLSLYLKENDTKFLQPKAVKCSKESDAAKRYQFFRMRSGSSERFVKFQTAQVTEEVVKNLKQGLSRMRSAQSFV